MASTSRRSRPLAAEGCRGADGRLTEAKRVPQPTDLLEGDAQGHGDGGPTRRGGQFDGEGVTVPTEIPQPVARR